MATGDFGNVADLIRAAIQNLYAKYEAQQIPADLQSITPRILSKSVAKPEEQKSIKVSRSTSISQQGLHATAPDG